MALMPGDWPMAQEVHTAFFSYCREDSEFALKLAADLKSAGAHVWIDQLDIEPGAPWDRAVEDALTSSPRMLVVLSPVSVNSDNVRDEVSFALSRQKRVIPVLYRDCDVPFRLARLQHVDFRPDYGRALRILLRALGVGEAAQAPVAAAPQPQEVEQAQRLEEERKLAAEQAELEAARQIASEKARHEQQEQERKEAEAEKARREQERRAQAEKARLEQEERERGEAETKATQEQLRREQRAAEQARLEEEARRAAEAARLAQEEQTRREAEIKARQEKLRREEQESVERKSLGLERLEREQGEREAAKQARLAEQARLEEERRHATEQRARLAQVPEVQITPPPGTTQPIPWTSPKYLAGGAILLVALGLLVFIATRRGGHENAPQTNATQNQPAEAASAQPQQPQTQASNQQSPAYTTPPATQPAVSEEAATKQEQGNTKTRPAASDKELAKLKNLARPAGNDLVHPNAAIEGVNGAKAEPGTAATPTHVRVSQGVSQGLLVQAVKPTYPTLARSARVQGTVVLQVVIAKDGTIKSINAISGHPMLVPAAIDAVKQWRYKPYYLNGKPVEMETTVNVNFTLSNSPQGSGAQTSGSAPKQ